MSADKNNKNNKNFEKILKTLGQRIRIDILKKLKKNESLLTFSTLQKEILETNQNSVNFSYHLKALEKVGLISSSDKGYFITLLGKKILKIILSMKQFIDDQNKVKMIRTSKYSKEVFDFKTIINYLIKEGELDQNLAKDIANEVKERLSKTKIEYMTAPLMREYINAILLEKGLEHVRHRLTRLGTPPYEALKLFKNKEISPERFIQISGSDVSEQFLLLNLLPNHLADLYLSGEIALCNLNYWSLRPLSIYLNTKSLISRLFNKFSIKLKNSRDYIKLILNFGELVSAFKPYISEDLLLGSFNKHFLSLFRNKKHANFLINILTSKFLKYSNSYGDGRSHISLEFCYKNKKGLKDKNLPNFQTDKIFIKNIENETNLDSFQIIPLILFDYTQSGIEDFILSEINPTVTKNNITFYNANKSHLLNSTVIRIKNSDENEFLKVRIILDKVLINLHLISLEANQNDDSFCDILQDRLNSVFEFFKYKEYLIKKKLNSLKKWEMLISHFLGADFRNWSKNSLKSVSFLGLNEAITNHCGIELDRIETSQSFALKILSLLNEQIKEKNENENECYILSQPHSDKYFERNNRIKELNKRRNFYSPRIIRKHSKLSLEKKISIFKKFEKIIEGGIIFNNSVNSDNALFKKNLKILTQSKINAFLID
ncbi:MAG: anaerobic ribonucleoside-triphosphate reductase [Candidatus Hodarchaeota archaeon]